MDGPLSDSPMTMITFDYGYRSSIDLSNYFNEMQRRRAALEIYHEKNQIDLTRSFGCFEIYSLESKVKQ